MKKLFLGIVLLLGTPALAQQAAPPDDTSITLTYGEINALVQARVADALAANAMKRLSAQLAPKVAKSPAPAAPPPAAPAAPPPPSQD